LKKRIPRFGNDAAAERFVATADLSTYDLAGFRPAHFEFQPKEAQISMRLPTRLLDAVKQKARAIGIPYTRLIRQLMEQAVSERGKR
jgi:predicted DNA binding CopG/RHH family protein